MDDDEKKTRPRPPLYGAAREEVVPKAPQPMRYDSREALKRLRDSDNPPPWLAAIDEVKDQNRIYVEGLRAEIATLVQTALAEAVKKASRTSGGEVGGPSRSDLLREATEALRNVKGKEDELPEKLASAVGAEELRALTHKFNGANAPHWQTVILSIANAIAVLLAYYLTHK